MTDAAESVVQPLSITAEHQTLFSVGEGILLGATEFSYSIRHGSIAVMDIQVDPRVRVLNVDGPDVRRWDVVQVSSDQTRHGKRRAARLELPEASAAVDSDSSDGESTPPPGYEVVKAPSNVTVLRVQLDHGITDRWFPLSLLSLTSIRYSLTVTHEVELHSTSCQFKVPLFSHTHDAFSRERGFIAVEARTNVEVEQV